jgi:hypothetical protein
VDILAGVYIGSLITAMCGIIAAAYWYVDNTEGWDHSPSDEEIGQRIIEDFILPNDR